MCGRYYIDEAMFREIEDLLQMLCVRQPGSAVPQGSVRNQGSAEPQGSVRNQGSAGPQMSVSNQGSAVSQESVRNQGNAGPQGSVRNQGSAEPQMSERNQGSAENVWAGDIHPGDRAPVLVRTMDGIRLVNQIWGLPVPEAYGKGLIFNARSESALEKPMFQDGLMRRRAVIPARGFYEWNRAKEKITFSQETGSVLYLAGFFNQYKEGGRFVILTTNANASMKATHDRMPLILNQQEILEWMEGGGERAVLERMLKKVPGELRKQAGYEQLSFL